MEKALKTAIRRFLSVLPIVAGVLLLIELVNPFLMPLYPRIFSGSVWLDPLFAAVAGSISFGIPVIAYLVGESVLKAGVPLMAVIAFVMAWTTVGVPMLPLEISFLGRRFALVRNAVNFVLAIALAIIASLILSFV